MTDIISVIQYNPDTANIDSDGMCRKICGYKWDTLERLEAILTNPDYNEDGYKNPCIVTNTCEKDMQDTCIFEFIKDQSI